MTLSVATAVPGWGRLLQGLVLSLRRNPEKIEDDISLHGVANALMYRDAVTDHYKADTSTVFIQKPR